MVKCTVPCSSVTFTKLTTSASPRRSRMGIFVIGESERAGPVFHLGDDGRLKRPRQRPARALGAEGDCGRARQRHRAEPEPAARAPRRLAWTCCLASTMAANARHWPGRPQLTRCIADFL